MAERFPDHKGFLDMAAALGLDTRSPHMDQLHEYVNSLMQNIGLGVAEEQSEQKISDPSVADPLVNRVFCESPPIEDLDLSGTEPAAVFIPPDSPDDEEELP